MIVIREGQERDIEALAKLATIPGFINLPDDHELLREKLQKSTASFRGEVDELGESKYMFIAEDLDSGKVLATSMIAGQHGTEDSPHFYFQIGTEQKFSDTINTGFIHGTLELKADMNGPAELGGLVVDPGFRGSDEKLGKQISFVRFLYVALNRSRFRDRVIAELLPPLNKKGQSPLWEAIGRRFTNMDYWEADKLCQRNKEFIFSLFPTGKIYTSFLTAEARNAIGKVGKETEPALHMLKKIGFKYMNQVDPFDGGPHLWANMDELEPLRASKFCRVSNIFQMPTENPPNSFPALVTKHNTVNTLPFKALLLRLVRDETGTVQIYTTDVEKTYEVLKIKSGDEIAFLPVN